MKTIAHLRPLTVEGHSVIDVATQIGARLERDGMPVTGASVNSTDIHPGDLFIAVPGLKQHGARFAQAAVENGAVAILTDTDGLDYFDDLPESVAILIVDDPRACAGPAAAYIYGYPARKLTTIGVTGTNGKTTTTHFIEHLCETLCGSTLLIGTVGISLGGMHVDSERTSIEAPALNRVLAWACEQGAQNVVMEVSSHAMSLHRVRGMEFDVVAFLNLQRDHLDFHGTMEEYFAAKASLFSPEFSRNAVVCLDDSWGRALAQQCEIPLTTVATDCPADWTVVAQRRDHTDAGTDITVNHGDDIFTMHCPLPGIINVQNAIVALATSAVAGIDPGLAARALADTPQVPGRMEVVSRRTADTPLVVVDFAHTPEALELACSALDPVTVGRLWLLFGATGDRDRGKRPLMAQAAREAADVVVVTDDDIYSEDPVQIRAEVVEGFDFPSERPRAIQLWEDDDRAHAINFAIWAARPADTVVIAGRGHETIQMVGDVPVHLDDRVCAAHAVEARIRRLPPDLSIFDSPGAGKNQLRKVPQTWEYIRELENVSDSGFKADGDFAP